MFCTLSIWSSDCSTEIECQRRNNRFINKAQSGERWSWGPCCTLKYPARALSSFRYQEEPRTHYNVNPFGHLNMGIRASKAKWCIVETRLIFISFMQMGYVESLQTPATRDQELALWLVLSQACFLQPWESTFSWRCASVLSTILSTTWRHSQREMQQLCLS